MLRHLRLFLVILAIAVLASAAPAFAQGTGPSIGDALSQSAALPSIQPMFSGCTRINVDPVNDAYEQRVVELVNIERAKYGSPPLKRTTELDQSARYHAFDMVQDDYFNHDSYDRNSAGALVMVCNTWARIANFYSGTGWRGENIAAGQTTPEIVMNSWINSKPHHDNMIDTNFNEIGVGYDSNFWVQDYGARDIYPVIINNEAYSTTARTVQLYQYGQGVWNEMCVHIDGSSCTWETFKTTFSENLTCFMGPHTISVDLRKTGQTSAAVTNSDTILLAGPSLGNIPNSVTFLYSQNQSRLYPSALTLQPLDPTDPQVLSWSVSKSSFSPDWLSLDLASGTTPNSKLTLTPISVDALSQGNYSGTLTFTAGGATCIGNNPHSIPVHLIVVADVKSVYLPAILR